jgi:hypothetical protein
MDSKLLFIHLHQGVIYIYTNGQVGRNFWYILYGFGRKKSFRPKFQSHLITIYVCLIAYRKRLVVEGIVI